MDYLSQYKKIIDRAKNRKLDKEQSLDHHHILPRSLWENQHAFNVLGFLLEDKNNLDETVDLLHDEHFMVHLFLMSIFKPESKYHNQYCYAKASNACEFTMITRNGQEIISNKHYRWIKEENAKNLSITTKEMWQDPEYIEKQRIANANNGLKKSESLKKLNQDPEFKKLRKEAHKNDSKKIKETWDIPGKRETHSIKMKELWKDPEKRENQSKKLKDVEWTQETIDKRNEGNRLAWQKPEVREKHKGKTSGEKNGMYGKSVLDVWIEEFGEEIANQMWKEKYKRSSQTTKNQTPEKKEEIHEKRSKASKEMWEDPEYRAKQTIILEETNESRSNKVKDLWKDPEYRDKQKQSLKERSEKISHKHKDLWKDPEYRAKRKLECKIRCNDPEYKERQRLLRLESRQAKQAAKQLKEQPLF